MRDESDLCVDGVIDWSSGTLTDHDGDGCKDDDEEDKDDDNDGVADSIDTCPRGATNCTPASILTSMAMDAKMVSKMRMMMETVSQMFSIHVQIRSVK